MRVGILMLFIAIIVASVIVLVLDLLAYTLGAHFPAWGAFCVGLASMLIVEKIADHYHIYR